MGILSCMILLAILIFALNRAVGPYLLEDDDDDSWGW